MASPQRGEPMPGHALSSSLVMLDDQAPAPRSEEACSEDGEPWLAIVISSHPENSWQDPRAEALAGPSQLTGVESPDDQPASRTLPEWAGVVPAGQGGEHGARVVEQPSANVERALSLQEEPRKIMGLDIASALPQRTMAPHNPTGGVGREAMVPRGAVVESMAWGKEGDECSICLGVMVAGEHVTDLPGCNHTFHLQCAAQWLKTKVESGRPGCCPHCNAPVVTPVFSDHQRPANGGEEEEEAEEEQTVCSTRWKLTIVVFIVVVIVVMSILAHSLFGDSKNSQERWT